jgi:hypothetical protein
LGFCVALGTGMVLAGVDNDFVFLCNDDSEEFVDEVLDLGSTFPFVDTETVTLGDLSFSFLRSLVYIFVELFKLEVFDLFSGSCFDLRIFSSTLDSMSTPLAHRSSLEFLRDDSR